MRLDLPRVIAGEDTRTTLMVRHIPNKYTQRMLLSVIEQNHSGQFDLLYLPIDFKNRCNVGYPCALPCPALPHYTARTLPHNWPARSPTCPGCETHTAHPCPSHTAQL